MKRSLDESVAQFADPERREAAFAALLGAGAAGHEAVRVGLSHPDWRVRRWCARFIDHHPDEGSMERLLLALHDPKLKVRVAATHALGCDLCKQGERAIDVVPHLIRRVREDRSIRVRRVATVMLALQPSSRRTSRFFRQILKDESDPKLCRMAEFGLSRPSTPAAR